MPIKDFLENCPLYKKYEVSELPEYINGLSKPTINMSCDVCNSSQTFSLVNHYHENCNEFCSSALFRALYRCQGCAKFHRTFFIKTEKKDTKSYMYKCGQYPGWEINSDKNITKLLGEYAGLYKKGLVCESQGYGIGAFSYYRRIVELIIQKLLDDIPELMSGEELNKYSEALSQTKKTIVASDKIELVKDLLPSILRPNDTNPLSLLHSVLSEGLHELSEDECLKNASACGEILVFLVEQIELSKESSKKFTDSMTKILEKKSKQKAKKNN